MTVSDATLSLFLLPAGTITAIILLFCFGGAGLLWLLMLRSGWLAPALTPQAAFQPAIMGLFALMLSFSVNDAWRRGDAAYTALLREAQEVAGVVLLLDRLDAAGETGAAPLRQSVTTYLRQSLQTEWSIQNVRLDPDVEAVMDGARLLATTGATAAGPRAQSWRTVSDRLDGLSMARNARLVAGGLYGDQARWATLALLYLAGAVALLATHLDRRRAAVLGLLIYAAASAAALSLVAVSEHPYAGWDAVTPDRLHTLLTRLERPTGP